MQTKILSQDNNSQNEVDKYTLEETEVHRKWRKDNG
jgi:hypothetical protein